MGDNSDDSAKFLDVDFANIFVIRIYRFTGYHPIQCLASIQFKWLF